MDGYCKQHHPDRQAKHAKKLREKRRARQRLQEIKHEIERLNRKCAELVITFADSNKDAADLAHEIMKLRSEAAELRKII